jgi:hypothetical protein
LIECYSGTFDPLDYQENKKFKSSLRSMKWRIDKVVTVCMGQFNGECAQFRMDVIILIRLSCLGTKLWFVWTWILLIEFGNVLLDITHLCYPIVICINVHEGWYFPLVNILNYFHEIITENFNNQGDTLRCNS